MPEEVSLNAATAAWPDPATLLPHGPRARCVDRVLDFMPGEQIRAAWRVSTTSPLFDPERDGIPSWAGIEIMAQCAGLYLGLTHRNMGDGGPPRSGFLVGVRRFRAHHPLLANHAELTLEAACDGAQLSAGELGLFDCRILCGDTVYADARLMLWSAGGETGGA
ncbi:MAG: hypothetical protein ACRETC_07655 [Gammaproteobacteria bacterium]